MIISSTMKCAFSMLNIIYRGYSYAQEGTYIQFADILEVLVHRLDQVVNEFEHGQLIHLGLHVAANDEVEGCVAPIGDLELAMLDEGALVLSPRKALAYEFAFEGDALLHSEAIIVLGEAGLPLLVHHQHELYHFDFKI